MFSVACINLASSAVALSRRKAICENQSSDGRCKAHRPQEVHCTRYRSCTDAASSSSCRSLQHAHAAFLFFQTYQTQFLSFTSNMQNFKTETLTWLRHQRKLDTVNELACHQWPANAWRTLGERVANTWRTRGERVANAWRTRGERVANAWRDAKRSGRVQGRLSQR